MQIDSNLAAMNISLQQLNSNIANISKIASLVASPELQEVSNQLVKDITEQIPTQIAYEANAGVISTQNAIQDVLLNLKA